MLPRRYRKDEAISIHALRKESDLILRATSSSPPEFQSTLSVRRATIVPADWYQVHAYFNPRSP